MYWSTFTRSPIFPLQQSRFPQRCQKILFHFGIWFSSDRRPRHEHELHWLGQIVLVKPEALSQQSPRSVANHGISDLLCRDDSQTRSASGGQSDPVCDQATIYQPSAFLSNSAEITPGFEPRRAAKP